MYIAQRSSLGEPNKLGHCERCYVQGGDTGRLLLVAGCLIMSLQMHVLETVCPKLGCDLCSWVAKLIGATLP